MAGRSRRTDLRLGALDFDKIFDNAVLTSEGKIDLSATSSVSITGEVTSISAGEVEGQNAIRFIINDVLVSQIGGTNPFANSATSSMNWWFNNHLLPGKHETYDIGSTTLAWRDLYLSGNTIYLGGTALSTNGTAINFVNNLNQTKVVAYTDNIPTITHFVDEALSSSTYTSTLTGPQGLQGSTGATGPQGGIGPQGPTGLTGPQGSQGPAGTNGQDGAQGPQGLQGDQGIQGVQGPQGPQGAVGPGIVFKGAVNADPSGSGLVTLVTAATFTPSQGDAVLSQVDDSLFIYNGSAWADGGSIQGPQGPQGIQGPQGTQGIQGTAGADGAQGPQGAPGTQGAAGAAGASVTNLTISNTTIAATLSDNTTISGSVSMGLTNLTDVDLYHTSSTITDGHVLTYDTTHGHWHPEPIQTAAANIALDDLSDVSASTITDHVIKYNGTSWDSSVLHDSNLMPNIKAATTGIQSLSGGSNPKTTIILDGNTSPAYVDQSTHKVVLDGVSLDVGDIFLIKDDGNIGSAYYDYSAFNGFWIIQSISYNLFAASTPWYSSCTRYTEDNYKSLRGGNFAFIEQGTVNAGKGFVCTNSGIPTIINGSGSDAINFSEIKTADPSQITKGNTSVTTTDSGANGTITFNTDGTNRWAFEPSGHLIPAANATYDIGEASNKVRHLYLDSNSLHIGSDASNTYKLGKDSNNDLTWTVNSDLSKVATQTGNLLTVQGDTTSAAIKLNCENNSHGITIQSPAHSVGANYTLTLPNTIGGANQVLTTDGLGQLDWVNQASGGSGGPEKMIVLGENLNLAPTFYPWYAFSKLRPYSTTYFDSNYQVLMKTITGTTVTTGQNTFSLATTNFPPGNYKFTWEIDFYVGSGTYYASMSENAIVDFIYSHSYSMVSRINSQFTLFSSRLSNVSFRQDYNALSFTVCKIGIEVIFKIATQSPINIWNPQASASINWFGANTTLLREYQEIEKLSSDYDFNGALTL